MADNKKDKSLSRRELVRKGAGSLAALGLGALFVGSLDKSEEDDMVWQLDPDKCVQCGRCATECVLNPSAVKCVHAFDVCGYCDLCFAYYRPGTMEFDTGAEKHLCPTFAIERTYIEHPYYEYIIDEDKCIGCAKCVQGCQTFGNGSLYLQVRHDICVNCNQCNIAAACPSKAFKKVPASKPYLLKGAEGNEKGSRS